jgi:acetylornithine deacetylase/succinyl-diaminopimelate desuccinylase-like protein
VDAVIQTLLNDPAVRAAREHIEQSDRLTVDRQAELSSIPAPTGAEGARAARVAALLRQVGLATVATDPAGNVRGWLGAPGEHPVVVTAHLDTVFGPEVTLDVARRGSRLEGPGIADNARGLAAMIAVAEALVTAGVGVRRPVLFAATVGEEGAGNLRGVRHLLNGGAPLQPHAFIALDGAGVQRVVHRALGSRRYRVTFRGPGGHSWAAFGVANPASAVGQAAAALGELPRSENPRATCAVVGLGGGTGLNSIPQTAWLDVDLRGEDSGGLEKLDRLARGAITAALEAENRRRSAGSRPLEVEIRSLGDRPSGVTPRSHPLVLAAVAANRALGWEAELASASTDANLPISLGIPAIALGAGGRSGDAHLPSEWYENADGAAGVVRALLVTLAIAELAAPGKTP